MCTWVHLSSREKTRSISGLSNSCLEGFATSGAMSSRAALTPLMPSYASFSTSTLHSRLHGWDPTARSPRKISHVSTPLGTLFPSNHRRALCGSSLFTLVPLSYSPQLIYLVPLVSAFNKYLWQAASAHQPLLSSYFFLFLSSFFFFYKLTVAYHMDILYGLPPERRISKGIPCFLYCTLRSFFSIVFRVLIILYNSNTLYVLITNKRQRRREKEQTRWRWYPRFRRCKSPLVFLLRTWIHQDAKKMGWQ